MPEAVKSADRALQVLELLSTRRDGLLFSEICSELGMPRSSTHALITTLARRRFITQEPGSGRYVLGVRIWELANASASAVTDLARMANPYLTQVRDAVQETVELAILDGTDVVYIGKRETDKLLTLVSRVGARLPAHATAIGKVLLAALDPIELDRRYDGYTFESFTARTLTSLADLHAELALVRERGFAEATGDFTEGVYCVAMPVRGASGTALAGMSTSVPTNRRTPAQVELMINELRQAVGQMSARLGYLPSLNTDPALTATGRR